MKRWPDHVAGQIYVSTGLLSGDHFGSSHRESSMFCLGWGIAKARIRVRKVVSYLLVVRLFLNPVVINRTP